MPDTTTDKDTDKAYEYLLDTYHSERDYIGSQATIIFLIQTFLITLWASNALSALSTAIRNAAIFTILGAGFMTALYVWYLVFGNKAWLGYVENKITELEPAVIGDIRIFREKLIPTKRHGIHINFDLTSIELIFAVMVLLWGFLTFMSDMSSVLWFVRIPFKIIVIISSGIPLAIALINLYVYNKESLWGKRVSEKASTTPENNPTSIKQAKVMPTSQQKKMGFFQGRYSRVWLYVWAVSVALSLILNLTGFVLHVYSSAYETTMNTMLMALALFAILWTAFDAGDRDRQIREQK